MIKRDHPACKLCISAQECCLGTWKWVLCAGLLQL